jgi:hypothetical protein
MGSFLDKIAKRLAVAKGSETLDGKTMTGEQPNKVVINPEIQIRSEDSNNFSFSEFLTEAAAKSGYSDEHATAKLWNHIVSHPNAATILSHPDHSEVLEEIEKAKKDPKHPLNIKNTSKDGFVGGKVNEKGYYDELKAAATTVHGLANHPRFAKAVKNKAQIRVTGNTPGKLTDTWNKNGAKNATSKADLVIEDKNERHGISLKKGDAQLASAEPNEMLATYDHATNKHMAEKDSEFTEEHKKDVVKKMRQVGEHMTAMKGTALRDEVLKKAKANGEKLEDDEVLKRVTAKQKEHLKKGQEILNGIHRDHPGLIKHISFEAATGHGKFGEEQEGSANVLVTSTPDGPHIHDTDTSKEPIEIGAPRLALPKSTYSRSKGTWSNRPGNFKLDYKAIRTPKKKKPLTAITNTRTAPISSAEETSEPERHHTLFWGRVNPPTAGHEQAYNVVRKVARQNGGTSSMVLSRSTDPKKNPLTPEQKEKHAKRAFPKVNTSVADPQHPTLLHQLSKLHEQGVTNLHMVAGSDRHPEYKKLINQYNGVKGNHGYYNFKKVELHSAGERDPDEEGTAGISASSQRAHATNGRQKEFAAASPSTMKPAHVKELYNDVRTGLSTPAPKKLKNVVKTKIAKAS